MALFTVQLNKAAAGALDGITHAQLHTGAPGAQGTDNVAPGVSRAEVSVAAPSGGSVVLTASFTIPDGGTTYTHVSFWTAASGGTCLGTDDPSPDATFSNPGSLSFTFTYTA